MPGITAPTRDAARISRTRPTLGCSEPYSTIAYSASAFSASATLPGSVHGVVVHATTNVGTPSASRSSGDTPASALAAASARNSTVTLGSGVSSL